MSAATETILAGHVLGAGGRTCVTDRGEQGCSWKPKAIREGWRIDDFGIQHRRHLAKVIEDAAVARADAAEKALTDQREELATAIRAARADGSAVGDATFNEGIDRAESIVRTHGAGA